MISILCKGIILDILVTGLAEEIYSVR